MQVQRFSFRDFSDEITISATGAKTFLPKDKRPAAPPPPQIFNEEQLKTAERDAYKKGFLEGTDEGRKQAESEQAAIDRRIVEAVEKCLQDSASLAADYNALALNLREQMPKIALSIARKVAGKALEQNAQALIEELAQNCMNAITGEPKFTVFVHASLGDALEKRLKEVASRLPSPPAVAVVKQAEMPLSDCRIEWARGAMERQTSQLWQHIEKITGAPPAAERNTESNHPAPALVAGEAESKEPVQPAQDPSVATLPQDDTKGNPPAKE